GGQPHLLLLVWKGFRGGRMGGAEYRVRSTEYRTATVATSPPPPRTPYSVLRTRYASRAPPQALLRADAGDDKAPLGGAARAAGLLVDLLEARQQAVAVRDLDGQPRPRVRLQQHRAVLGIDHDVHADVPQADRRRDLARHVEYLAPARHAHADQRRVGVG